MARTDIWLQLGEEFGGTPFGPLGSGEVRIGTAADTHVRVAVGLGVEAQHARVIGEGQDAWLLAPVERSAEIWLLRAGQRDPVPLRAPTTVRVGDAFMLGSPHGVRFHLVARQAPRSRAGGAAAPATAAGTVDMYRTALAGEVLRRVRAAILTTWLGRMVQNTWLFIRTGQLFSPVYIIGMIGMISAGTFGFMNWRRAADTQQKLEAKETALKACEGSGVEARSTQLAAITQGELVALALGVPAWQGSLEWGPMQDAMKSELKDLLERPDLADGSWAGASSDYQQALRALQSAGFPPEAAQSLAWVAVDPLVARRPQAIGADGPYTTPWLPPSAPGNYASCASGLFRLTYRQADALGVAASEDGWFDANSFPDKDAIQQGIERVLGVTRMSVDPSATPQEGTGYQQAAFRDGSCVFREGVDDQRADAGAVARAMAARFGPAAGGFPKVDENNGISGRIAAFYAMDARQRRGREVSVDAGPLRAAFDDIVTNDADAAALIAQRTGQAIARAVAIPCRVTLKMSEAPDLPVRPPLEVCAILRERARQGR